MLDRLPSGCDGETLAGVQSLAARVAIIAAVRDLTNLFGATGRFDFGELGAAERAEPNFKGPVKIGPGGNNFPGRFGLAWRKVIKERRHHQSDGFGESGSFTAVGCDLEILRVFRVSWSHSDPRWKSGRTILNRAFTTSWLQTLI